MRENGIDDSRCQLVWSFPKKVASLSRRDGRTLEEVGIHDRESIVVEMR